MSIRYKFSYENEFNSFILNGRKGMMVRELREYLQSQSKINVQIINQTSLLPYSDNEWLHRSICVFVKQYRPQSSSTCSTIVSDKVPPIRQSRGIPKNIKKIKHVMFDDSHLAEKDYHVDLKCGGDAELTIFS